MFVFATFKPLISFITCFAVERLPLIGVASVMADTRNGFVLRARIL